jgi:hypothetical protein
VQPPSQQQGQQQQHLTQEDIDNAAAHAVLQFWGVLESFVAIGKMPKRWAQRVPQDHCFVGVNGDGHLVLNKRSIGS